ncbi:MAG: DsbA family protein [Azospirillaceae bacterium]
MHRRTLIVGGAAGIGAIGLGGPRLARLAHAQDLDVEIGEDEFVLGDPDAPVTMVEYASFTCPHCAAFHNDVLPEFKTRFIDTGEVRMVFRDFPLDGLALRASMMAECIGGDSYFNVVGALFETQAQWARAQDPLAALGNIGTIAGLSQADFDACMNDIALAESIVEERQEGIDRYNVQATPSFIVNGEMHAGNRPIEYWQELVDRLLGRV